MLFCCECILEGQQHISVHRDYILNYDNFIDICKSFSLKNKENNDSCFNGKHTNSILAKLDK